MRYGAGAAVIVRSQGMALLGPRLSVSAHLQAVASKERAAEPTYGGACARERSVSSALRSRQCFVNCAVTYFA